MKLLTKFSLIFIVVFGLGLCASGFLGWELLQRNAREQVLDNAEVMMEGAMAVRRYTDEQVKPALLSCANAAEVFRPQTVPAYAATETFNYLREKYRDYTYKEAALSPTNPRDLAREWEEEIIRYFRNRPRDIEGDTDMTSHHGVRTTEIGESLYLARPLVVTSKSCLQCHWRREDAPPAMLENPLYTGGFGWKDGEIIGAQIVSVPLAKATGMAERAFYGLMLSQLVVGGATLLIVNLLLYVAVIRPIGRFAAAADRISKGQMDIPEQPVKGRDEISVLAAAFNRMHRSLAAAMKMLEKK